MDGLSHQSGRRSAARLAALPAPAPLAMPQQHLGAGQCIATCTAPPPAGIGWRRVLVLGGATAMGILATNEMALVLNGATFSPPTVVMLALFAMLFAWIGLAFISALVGFAVLWLGDRRALLQEADPALLQTRTALLVPIHNEQPAMVFGAIAAMHDSLSSIGATHAFDFFVLSDTTNPDLWIAEEAQFLEIRGRLPDGSRIHYRRRKENRGRKVGNIADWITRFGAAYDHFVVLDADSVMDGGLLVRLAACMQRNRDVGLIQTLPMGVGGQTLLARMQQFAGRVHGVLVAAGAAWWQGREGNYYGHNAIIRTRAFAASCGLPQLLGRKPFGGEILSHDFVEAALLRRAGWGVLMLPTPTGSHEQGPPNLIEAAIRDRRWCQGNLQHLAVLGAAGLHPISRLHFLSGIGAYLTAPLWLAFLLGGIALTLQAHFSNPVYFPSGPALFPNWPVIDPVRAKWMFLATMLMLIVPKLLAALVFLRDRRDRQQAGGAVRVLAGTLLELVVSGLLAPVTMLTQARQVVVILLGRDSGWGAPGRNTHGVTWRQAARRYWAHTCFGLVLASAFLVVPALAVWMSPVILGLLLAIPLAVLTGSAAAGRALRRAGLLVTPEEAAPSGVLRATAQHRARLLKLDGGGNEAVTRLASDDALLALHRRLLPPRRRHRQGNPDLALATGMAKLSSAGDLAAALALLDGREKAAALGNVAGLTRLVALARRSAIAAPTQPHVAPGPQQAFAGPRQLEPA
jgi:membrane glycosyltransferase